MNKTLHSILLVGTAGRIPDRWRGDRQTLYILPKTETRTSGTSWVKRTTQGHGKCHGRSRMERALQILGKMHKECPKKSPFVDIEPCRKAGIPIVKAIIMQFTILSHKSSIVKGFLKNILKFFEFDKNRQIFSHSTDTRIRTVSPPRKLVLFARLPPDYGVSRQNNLFNEKTRKISFLISYIHTLFPKIPSRSVYKSKRIWYTIRIDNYVRNL